MPQSVLERLAHTRRRLRRVLWIHGLCWLVGGALAAITVAALADWLFHVSSGMRVLFLIAAAGVAGYLAFRRLVTPLTVDLTDLGLAQRLEKLHPELKEELSSSIDFLRRTDNDPVYGSKSLREYVIASAVRTTEPISFDELVEPKPAKKAGAWALAVLCIAGALVVASPSDAAIALRRLASPFGGPQWPQRTRLELVSFPTKVPKGDSFAVTVAASGDVPSRIVAHFKFGDAESSTPEPLRIDSEGLFRGGLDSVSRPFRFSISGGDARTKWIDVDVVPAPELTSLQLSLDYPEYSGLESETYAEGRGHVRAVIGTTVAVEATSNKPLDRAELEFDDGEPVVAELSEDAMSLSASFVVEQNTQYRVILFDAEGMSNTYRTPKSYRIEAIPDRAPEITIQHPAGDMETTAAAVVPVRALVKDDFGSDEYELHYEVLGSFQETPEKREPTVIALGRSEPPEKIHRIEHKWSLESLELSHGAVVRFFLQATDAKTPEPNVGKSREVRLHIVTKDDFLKRLDNEQHLVREELERVLKMQQNALTHVDELQKQADIVGELDNKDIERLQSAEMIQRRIREKLADSEQSVQNQVGRLLDEMKNNNVDDVESSKRLLLMQSELARIAEQHLPPITDSLTEAEKTAKLQAEAKARGEGGDSQADPKPSAQTGESSAESKGRPSGQSKASEGKAAKPQAGQPSEDAGQAADAKSDPKSETTDASEPKVSDAKSDPGADAKSDAPDAKPKSDDAPDAEGRPERARGENRVADNLGDAQEHQEQVVASIGQMLEQLGEWETIHQVTSDARDLQRRQSEVKEQVDELADKTLGKQTEDLTPEERADIAKAGARQDDSREQFLRLQRKMNRLANQDDEADPLTADLLKETLDELQKQNVAGKMADSSEQIKGNRMGDAGASQQQIEQALQDLVSALEDRQEQELARLVKKLREAEQELQGIREEQRRLLQKSKEAEQIEEPKEREDELKRLARRQKELQQKAEEFAQRLSRLRSQQASRSTGRAASRMRDAGQQMQGQNGDDAQQRQEDALEELQRAQEELAQDRQEAEQQLAEEQLARISDAIRQIHQRELSIKEELMRLENLRQKQGRLTRGELQSILSLSRAQQGLSDEAEHLTEKLSQAKVFVLVIEEAVEFMREAADRLQQRKTDEPTQFAVDSAASRFAQLLESLKSDPNEGGDQQQEQQAGGGGGGGGGGGQDGIPNVAQIRLLKGLQQQLLDETTQLAQAKAQDDDWDETQQSRFERLSKRQGRLADLVREISQPAPEEEPEPLFPGDRQ